MRSAKVLHVQHFPDPGEAKFLIPSKGFEIFQHTKSLVYDAGSIYLD
jgi:hypothetical protein